MLPPLQKKCADVCLILEDSYPYRQGGEAMWVHNLINALPRVKFAVVHVSTDRLSKVKRGLRFKLPRNVTTVVDAFIFDPPAKSRSKTSASPSKNKIISVKRLNRFFEAFEEQDFDSILRQLVELSRDYSFDSFIVAPEVDGFIADLCEREFPDEPFVDFVNHFYNTARPLWRLARQFDDVPLADSYHVVGTGHAGLLAVIAKLIIQKPLLVSELAVTVRNRIGELLRSQWSTKQKDTQNTLRHLSIEFHLLASRLTYQTADRIVSPFQKNADQQAEFGADAEKTRIIPNGINLTLYEAVRRHRIELLRSDPDRATVGFLGRISPQKDLKTLIQAARLTIDEIPEARFILAGAKGDERGYFHECEQLVNDLNLKDHVSFPGHLSVEKALAEFDILAASNVSDGQPISILEALASQIPVIATDVGDCERLLLGEDKKSPAGMLVGIGDARKMADAFIDLLQNAGKRNRFGTTGRERIEAEFSSSGMVDGFRDAYDQFAGRVTEKKSDVDKRRKSQPKPAGLLT